MEQEMKSGFCIMTETDMMNVEGGGVVDSVVNGIASIYSSWCDMWHDFGANLYYQFH